MAQCNISRMGSSEEPFKVGDVLISARTDLDDKWLLCNGESVNSNDYSLIKNLLPISTNTNNTSQNITYANSTSAIVNSYFDEDTSTLYYLTYKRDGNNGAISKLSYPFTNSPTTLVVGSSFSIIDVIKYKNTWYSTRRYYSYPKDEAYSSIYYTDSIDNIFNTNTSFYVNSKYSNSGNSGMPVNSTFLITKNKIFTLGYYYLTGSDFRDAHMGINSIDLDNKTGTCIYQVNANDGGNKSYSQNFYNALANASIATLNNKFYIGFSDYSFSNYSDPNSYPLPMTQILLNSDLSVDSSYTSESNFLKFEQLDDNNIFKIYKDKIKILKASGEETKIFNIDNYYDKSISGNSFTIHNFKCCDTFSIVVAQKVTKNVGTYSQIYIANNTNLSKWSLYYTLPTTNFIIEIKYDKVNKLLLFLSYTGIIYSTTLDKLSLPTITPDNAYAYIKVKN